MNDKKAKKKKKQVKKTVQDLKNPNRGNKENTN